MDEFKGRYIFDKAEKRVGRLYSEFEPAPNKGYEYEVVWLNTDECASIPTIWLQDLDHCQRQELNSILNNYRYEFLDNEQVVRVLYD